MISDAIGAVNSLPRAEAIASIVRALGRAENRAECELMKIRICAYLEPPASDEESRVLEAAFQRRLIEVSQ